MDFNIQGVTEKMFLGEKDAYLTKEHLFWDTWYIAIELMRNLQYSVTLVDFIVLILFRRKLL